MPISKRLNFDFIGVLPVMAINIRRMQRERLG